MCECCGEQPKKNKAGAPVFQCRCMDDVVCKRCNHCLTHCLCADADIEIPYPEQLSIAKYEWALMGVRV